MKVRPYHAVILYSGSLEELNAQNPKVQYRFVGEVMRGLTGKRNKIQRAVHERGHAGVVEFEANRGMVCRYGECRNKCSSCQIPGGGWTGRPIERIPRRSLLEWMVTTLSGK